MDFHRELNFIISVLRKQRVHAHILDSEAVMDMELDLDFGLRRLSHRTLLDMEAFKRSFGELRSRTIYKLKDVFNCCYIALLLPEGGKMFMIGPYTTADVSGDSLTEVAARLSIPPTSLRRLEDCFANIPYIPMDGMIFSLVYSFAELLWEKEGGYEVLDLNEELQEQHTPVETSREQPGVEDTVVAMQLMEQRYAWENELMLMVSRGQSSRAAKMLPDMANFSFKQRLTDPVRNMKNYCIICNTLMRKAAQQGGVHPMYLDSVSSEYALRIESQTDAKTLTTLVGEMIHTYCRLVKKHSMKDYSSTVRRAILLIDSQLAGELNLRYIASVLDINASYLSTVFKKETGHTLTDFICSRRVEQAANLLRNTAMQIQDVAIYCGIPDANYFSKVFKKYKGSTPAEYRKLPKTML